MDNSTHIHIIKKNLASLSSAGHQDFLWDFSNCWSLRVSYPIRLSVFSTTCSGVLKLALISWHQLVRANVNIFCQIHFQWCHISSLKSPLLLVFTPWKWTNARSQVSFLSTPASYYTSTRTPSNVTIYNSKFQLYNNSNI